jgi:hypothetical protein
MSTLDIDDIPDPDRDLTVEEIKAMQLPELKETCDRLGINRPVRSNKQDLQNKLFVHHGFPVESHHNNRITKSSSKNEIVEALRIKGIIGLSKKNKDDLYAIYIMTPSEIVPYLTRERMLERLDELGETKYSRLGLEQIRELLSQAESLVEENSPSIDKYAIIRSKLTMKGVPDLRTLCKERGIKGYAHARKPSLIEMLLPRD